MRYSRIVIALLSIVALGLVACQQLSPQEKVAALRGKYTATVNESGFAARAIVPEPEIDEMVEGEESGAAAVDEGDTMDPADDVMLDPPALEPLRYDIFLDIVVATTARETLPSLTVDVVHLDSGKREKKRWQVTLDTSKVFRGPGAQITHELKDVEYVEGDIFFTEVRQPVPAAEVSKYPELANAA